MKAFEANVVKVKGSPLYSNQWSHSKPEGEVPMGDREGLLVTGIPMEGDKVVLLSKPGHVGAVKGASVVIHVDWGGVEFNQDPSDLAPAPDYNEIFREARGAMAVFSFAGNSKEADAAEIAVARAIDLLGKLLEERS